MGDSVISELVWAQDPPTEPGSYWTMRGAWNDAPVVRSLVKFGCCDSNTEWIVSDGHQALPAGEIAWWAGPIPIPTLAICRCDRVFTPDPAALLYHGAPMCESCWERLGDE